ncbi:ABC transporter ATP-binding protein [Methylomonas sp. EFPC3]|uniref:ABC transporter ATP-binding protein n=1 Tax=Methylomonas sp. EFPC3 TaxID=3021710 RepID=UPI0024175CA9|nr:ABC transporter ATP-binding protein [Methylomonas sp. EFPC3]WFP51290.1 ABC transporter ATP-binding protein [Methylomonas sp. EFPC3]
MAIIEVNHLTKEYQLGHLTSLKETAVNAIRRLSFQPTISRERFKALDNVNFAIDEGEVVGIIGHNGAGKSTLLKHLANISKPTKGNVVVRGSIAPLIEVGAGVNPELTGRENIFLNGSILGIPKKIIQQKLDEIINFSELEKFIDTPVKRYSSGMTVKLGFSIATSLDADILIIDEVLAVGDLAFQRKCFNKMEDMIIHQGKTVLLVSHNIRQIERICKRVLLMDHGKIVADGSPAEICGLFYAQNDEKIKEQSHHSSSSARKEHTDDIELLSVKIYNKDGSVTESIRTDENITFKLHFRVNKELEKPNFGFGIHTTDFLYLATEITESLFADKILTPGEYTLAIDIPSFPLLPGVFSVRIGVDAGRITRNIFYEEGVITFQVTAPDIARTQSMTEGFLALNGKWSFQ